MTDAYIVAAVRTAGGRRNAVSFRIESTTTPSLGSAL